jgi:hypothetical protein
MDHRAIDELRSLVLRDRELAEGSSHLRSLDVTVAEIGSRAERIAAFFVSHAERDERLRQIEAHEAAALVRRRSEREEAHAELERAHSAEERALAEKRLARAADHVELARRALEHARGERQAFDEETERLMLEVPQLEERARALGATDDNLFEWASSKHAELFVALGQLDTQREGVIREANELATALLGESTFGSTPAQALKRVEAYCTSSPGQVSESR